MLLLWFAVVCYYLKDVVTVILFAATAAVVAASVGHEVVFVIYFGCFAVVVCCFAVVALVGCLLFAEWFAMFAMSLCLECC